MHGLSKIDDKQLDRIVSHIRKGGPDQRKAPIVREALELYAPKLKTNFSAIQRYWDKAWATNGASPDSRRGPVKCQYCPRTFKGPAGLGSHMATSHPEHHQPAPRTKKALAAKARKSYYIRKADRLAAAAAGKLPPSMAPVVMAATKYCPNCGCNLQAVNVALSL